MSKAPPTARAASHRRLREKRRAAAKRLELRMRGLTRRGTPRKLQIWPKHLFYGCKTTAEKHTIRMRIRGQANLAAGLRWDGKPRKNKYWTELDPLTGRERNIKRTIIQQRHRRAERRQTPLDRAWQQFRQSAAGILPAGLNFSSAFPE